jgi:hypothetical protein
LVIDLAPYEEQDGRWLYAPNPGGAPGNVAVGLARLRHKALMLAKLGDEAFGRLISADPNFREPLWHNGEEMLRAGRHLVAQAAVVKLSEDELFALVPGSSIERAARSLWHDGLTLMAVTRGAAGAAMLSVNRIRIDRDACGKHGLELHLCPDAGPNQPFETCQWFDLQQCKCLPAALIEDWALPAKIGLNEARAGETPDAFVTGRVCLECWTASLYPSLECRALGRRLHALQSILRVSFSGRCGEAFGARIEPDEIGSAR